MERRSASDFDAVVEQTNRALIAFDQGDFERHDILVLPQ